MGRDFVRHGLWRRRRWKFLSALHIHPSRFFKASAFPSSSVRRAMKGMYTDASEPLALVQSELQQLRRTTRRLQLVVVVLGILILVLFVSLAAVGGSQGSKIKQLDKHKGLLPHPNVAFASQTGNRKLDGLTYGGSLFRGSGFWAPKVILPNKLSDHAAIGVDPDEVIYIIGGALADGNCTAQVWKYDAVFRTYAQVAAMPEPRYRFGAALLDRKIYIVGGRNSSKDADTALVKSTFIYDIANNRWSRGADQIDYHGDTCAASLNGKVYMVGGYGLNYSYLNTVEVYDPVKNEWSKAPNMPTPRGDLMCAAFDGELYVLGGYSDSSGKNTFSSKMESYNSNTRVWTTRPDLLTPRGDAAVVVLPGNKLMLVGGEGHYRDNDTFKYPNHVNEVFYGDDQTWVQKAMIPTPRFRTAAAVTGGLAFVFGGADVCIALALCPIQNTTEVFLDVDHPRVYMYLRDEAYDANSVLTTYPV